MDFRLFERNRTLDKKPRNDPHEREEQHAEHGPRQREAEHPRGHGFRKEIVQQRQTEERNEERGGAGD